MVFISQRQGDGTTSGKVYFRTPAGEVRQVADGIAYANGVAVSVDGKMLYVVESDRHRLLAFSIGDDSSLSSEQTLVDLQQALGDRQSQKITPDGLRLDRKGRMFVGLYDGGGFAILSSAGRVIRTVLLPGQHHANLAISPNGKRVFVTATDGASGGSILTVANPLAD